MIMNNRRKIWLLFGSGIGLFALMIILKREFSSTKSIYNAGQ
jgi:hypothetical protein